MSSTTIAGSGTTGHAVINLNREDGGRRKFILVEMGDYFHTVLLPRIKKVTFTPEWKDGKPKRIPKPEEVERSPRIIKVLRLESYEDTLNNLELTRTKDQQELLDGAAGLPRGVHSSYLLDVESRGSVSLLNVDGFEDPSPISSTSRRERRGRRSPRDRCGETFNYLIGLHVATIDHIDGVRAVTGQSPEGERVLVLWRRIKELNNDALDEWFGKRVYNTRDQEFDVIYGQRRKQSGESSQARPDVEGPSNRGGVPAADVRREGRVSMPGFQPVFTITNPIAADLTRIERARGFLEAHHTTHNSRAPISPWSMGSDHPRIRGAVPGLSTAGRSSGTVKNMIDSDLFAAEGRRIGLCIRLRRAL